MHRSIGVEFSPQFGLDQQELAASFPLSQVEISQGGAHQLPQWDYQLDIAGL